MSFCVQLVVRSCFNRLQRKYECLCVLCENVFWLGMPVCLHGLRIKNLKLFSRFIWWLGRKVLTLHQETKKQIKL